MDHKAASTPGTDEIARMHRTISPSSGKSVTRALVTLVTTTEPSKEPTPLFHPDYFVSLSWPVTNLCKVLAMRVW